MDETSPFLLARGGGGAMIFAIMFLWLLGAGIWFICSWIYHPKQNWRNLKFHWNSLKPGTRDAILGYLLLGAIFFVMWLYDTLKKK